MLGDFKGNVALRAAGHAKQGHVGFSGGAVAFLDIASQAGRHYVFPGITTSPRARQDMVDGQVVPAIAAILASVIIPVQDVAPG